MNNLKGIIFDMDGVIVDSEPLQLESYNQILEPYNVSLTKYDFLELVGKTQQEIFENIKDKFGISESVDNLITKKREKYLLLVNTKMHAMNGLYKLLNWLKRLNFKIGIASSSPLADIFAVIRSIKIEKLFDVILSSTNLPNGKPAPDVFLLTAQKMKVNPSECIVIEDSGIGVEAAKRAKMICIAIPNFFTQDQDFTKADYLVNNLEEALKILENIVANK